MKYFLPVASLILLLSSCGVSRNYLTVEFREPAKVTFPPEVVNIVVVDNSYIPEGGPKEIVSPKGEISIQTDSARAHIAVSLAKYMQEEEFFNNVIYYPHFRQGGDSIQIYLTNQEIVSICKETNSDALISINQSAISGSMEIYAYDDNRGLLQVGVMTNIKAYRPDGIPYHESYLLSDTLYWEGIPEGMNVYKSSRYSIINIQKATMEAAEIAADRLTEIYTPYWKKETRHFYAGSSSEMKKAATYAEEYKWEEASTIWEDLYNKENKPLTKAYMAYNIALANECLNEIDKALQWNKTALDLLSQKNNSKLRQSVTGQNKVLKNREKQVKQLELQYGTD